jgi:hypothetical protein
MPSEMAEENAETARGGQGQAAHDGAEYAQDAEEDAAAARAVFGDVAAADAMEDAAALHALVGKVHAADSTGRLLSSP